VEQRRVLRPLALMEIVDQTFRLYRSNFWLFVGVASVPWIPGGVVLGALLVSFTTRAHGVFASQRAMEDFFGSPENLVPVLVAGVVGGVLFVLASLLVSAALTRAISDRYLGKPVGVRSAYRDVVRRLGAFLGTMFCVYLPWLLFLVPILNLFLAVYYFWVRFATQVFIIENQRNFAAVKRSRVLVGGGVWAQLLVVGFVIQALGWVVSFGLGQAADVPLALLGPDSMVGNVVSVLGAILGMVVVMPVMPIATTLIYYDSRIRKEGFDLQMLAQELGEQLPPAAEPAVSAEPLALAAEPVAPAAEATPEDGQQV
jgi:hypothetical protein